MSSKGILYGVEKLTFKGVELGYISEEGMTPGGEAPTKTRIYAAQKRDTPVAVLQSNAGSMSWSFTLIQLNGENLKAVMGGEVDSNGVYTPSTDETELRGEFQITTVSGETIVLKEALLTAQFANNINMSGVLGVNCEIEVMKPADGSAAWSIKPAVTA